MEAAGNSGDWTVGGIPGDNGSGSQMDPVLYCKSITDFPELQAFSSFTIPGLSRKIIINQLP
jgi:hypothetical protein